MSAAVRPASLPMYDVDRDAVDAWWTGLATAMRAEGITGVPDDPDWPDDLAAHWRDPRLLISQTCGYPLVTQLEGVVQVVGAFRYGVPGCEGILYRSELVARDDATRLDIEDFRGGVAVINDRDSYSGCHALRALAAPLATQGRFFAREVVSGSHRDSLASVADGTADIAAVDCITLAGLRRKTPESLRGLKVIGSTDAAPGLPLVTSADTPSNELRALRRALAAAAGDPKLADVREALFIDGFEVVPLSTWKDLVNGSDAIRPAATQASRRSPRCAEGSSRS